MSGMKTIAPTTITMAVRIKRPLTRAISASDDFDVLMSELTAYA